MSADGRPVLDKIMERLPLTVGMNVISPILTLIIAIPIGILFGLPPEFPSGPGRDGLRLSRLCHALVLAGIAADALFGIHLQWLPISGLTSMNFDSLGPVDKVLDLARHLALPILVYTIGSLAGMSRYMRACMLEVLRQDYILTAQAKGLSPRTIIWRHALRNALLPVITLLGLSVPGLIGGSVIIESIFALPGLGQLFYAAVMARDYTMIMGNLVLGAVLTLLGNLLADVCYGLADPRIRSSREVRWTCGPLLRRFLGAISCSAWGWASCWSCRWQRWAPPAAPYASQCPASDHILEPPSSMFWLGTDRLGRDVFSRLLYGGRISLWVGFVAVGISVSIGTGAGPDQRYFGGLVDEGIMRGVDIMLSASLVFPRILSVIAFLEPSLTNITIVIGLDILDGVARLVRAETPEPASEGFCFGGASVRLFHLPDIAAPYPAQHTGPCAHFRHAGRGRRHPGGIRAQFSRTWRPAAHGQLGNMLMEGKTVLEDAPGFPLSGCRHPGDRTGLQPSG